ncbi:hypothetical protein NHX12_018231 [Muraenolepis orangiensis]|uniref:Uncharacterized protein n=1 Tax=Muraenolepis orangiensis TaxID=630683 RepID=A0A9Q0EYZ8_9TELE|nr:hypothetical protein NHX12_018231 [Muraenolepis orangiensis]
MYSAPPEVAVVSAPEEMKNTQSSPTAPLLAPQANAVAVSPYPAQPGASLSSTDSSFQFHVDTGNTSNFL